MIAHEKKNGEQRLARKFMRHTENKDLLQRIGEDTICELCLRI